METFLDAAPATSELVCPVEEAQHIVGEGVEERGGSLLLLQAGGKPVEHGHLHHAVHVLVAAVVVADAVQGGASDAVVVVVMVRVGAVVVVVMVTVGVVVVTVVDVVTVVRVVVVEVLRHGARRGGGGSGEQEP